VNPNRRTHKKDDFLPAFAGAPESSILRPYTWLTRQTNKANVMRWPFLSKKQKIKSKIETAYSQA
jgi:hypothetical protein